MRNMSPGTGTLARHQQYGMDWDFRSMHRYKAASTGGSDKSTAGTLTPDCVSTAALAGAMPLCPHLDVWHGARPRP